MAIVMFYALSESIVMVYYAMLMQKHSIANPYFFAFRLLVHPGKTFTNYRTDFTCEKLLGRPGKIFTNYRTDFTGENLSHGVDFDNRQLPPGWKRGGDDRRF